MEITDVLGRTRTVDKVFPAGEWNCPFCLAAVDPAEPCRGYSAGCSHPAHCPNPACYANTHYPVARAREEVAESERKKAEEARRKEAHDWAMRRAQEERQARERRSEEIRTEAIQRGACVTCALRSVRFQTVAKFTKHRAACPVR